MSGRSRKTRNKELVPSLQPWRMHAVKGLLILLFGVVAARVLALQVLNSERGAEFLRQQGDSRVVRTAEIPAYRGLISDRRGEPLAVSTPVVSLWADPPVLSQSMRLDELSEALQTSRASLEEKIEHFRGRRYMYLRRHLVPMEARKILALKIDGIQAKREYRRFYPAGEVAAQLVGMTDLDGDGLSGLELAYDNWLQGSAGKKRYIKDLKGGVVRDIGVIRPVQPGRNLRLSIDLRLQYLLHRELERASKVTGAVAGVITTLDSHTGEVLASASYPNFNPNNRNAVQMHQTRNRALTDVFEPGSTMKPLTMVAALESGMYTVDSVIDTSPGRIRVGTKVLPDPRNYGRLSLSQVVEKSSQVGITKVALDLGHEPVREVFQRFGLGRDTATGFPGERGGKLPNRERWSAIEQVTLAFGYGLTATPTQLARAYSVFANGGVLPEVTLLKRDVARSYGERIISANVASAVREVLHAVTESDGTGRRAQIPGFLVGGKTGTVHKVANGRYIDDQYLALFVGMAPIDAPRFVTVVILDRPQGDDYGGGSAAAPVFARVAGETLRLLGIPPSSADAPKSGNILAAAAKGAHRGA